MGAPSEAGVDLRTPAGQRALRVIVGDDAAHRLGCLYPTWESLRAAGTTELSHTVGVHASTLTAELPHLPALPPSVTALTRFCVDYPPALAATTAPPAVLHVTGGLPRRPLLCIAGSHHPSATGLEVTVAVAAAAAQLGVPVVVPLQTGCALQALEAVLAAAGVVVVVMPHGFGVTSTHQVLLERVLENRGAVVTAVEPGMPSIPATVSAAAHTAVGLATAVALPEVGLHPSAGQDVARAAINGGRYLLAPRPAAGYIPPSAAGLPLLSSARDWDPGPYGTSARIENRVHNGLPPADALVSDHAELIAALTSSGLISG